jgi:hypothetical protein
MGGVMVQDRVLELLESADWKDIVFRLTHYAVGKACRYTWKSGSLPGGKTPQDMALDAIEKVWMGVREWNPNKYPNLYTHLKWIVDSDIDHLSKSMEHDKSRRMPETTFDQASETPNPEEQLIAKENKAFEDEIREEVYEMVEGDEDLETLMLCFDEGIDKPRHIAEQTGWDVPKVNNIKRKLFRKAAKLKHLIRKGEK